MNGHNGGRQRGPAFPGVVDRPGGLGVSLPADQCVSAGTAETLLRVSGSSKSLPPPPGPTLVGGRMLRVLLGRRRGGPQLSSIR
jgi:hypothetical protein